MRMLTLLLLMSSPALAEIVKFGAGVDAFEIEFVEIGSAVNPFDERLDPEVGGVDYVYSISKFETSCSIVDKAHRSGAFAIHTPPHVDIRACRDNGPNWPSGLNLHDARLVANWLNTSSGFLPAYKVDESETLLEWDSDDLGFDIHNLTRNSLARYFVSNGDEWHKAAYYDPVTETYNDYATGNVEPTPVTHGTQPNTAVISRVSGWADVDQAGGLSAAGTMGQTGNIDEWEEDGVWYRTGVDSLQFAATNSRLKDRDTGGHGFRVVRVPDSGLLVDCQTDNVVDAEDLSCIDDVIYRDHILQVLGTLLGDLDSNGEVEFDDFLVLSAHFGEDPAPYTHGNIDLLDGVTFDDFRILSSNFGRIGKATALSVPEPSGQTLLVAGLLCLATCCQFVARFTS